MKLLYIDPRTIPAAETEALQILQNVDALGAIGVDVTLLTPQPKIPIPAAAILGRPLSANVCLHYLTNYQNKWWYPSGSNFLYFRQVAYWLRQHGHSFDAMLIRNLKLAAFLLRIPGIPPLFFEMHEIFAPTYRENHPVLTRKTRRKYQLLQQREGFVYNHAAGLIALSDLLAQDIRLMYQTVVPMVTVRNGVDLSLAATATRTEPNAIPVLLYLGNLHPWKGVEMLIDTMQYVPSGILWIAGGTPSRVAELTALAIRRGVANKIKFLGEIAPKQRFQLIAQADICLLPLSDTSVMASRYTCPLKLFEYMAKCRAVIATDLPSVREILVDGENALLVTPGQPTAFAQAVNRLVDDVPLREKLGMVAGNLAQKYRWVDRANAMSAFITGALSCQKQ